MSSLTERSLRERERERAVVKIGQLAGCLNESLFIELVAGNARRLIVVSIDRFQSAFKGLEFQKKEMVKFSVIQCRVTLVNHWLITSSYYELRKKSLREMFDERQIRIRLS